MQVSTEGTTIGSDRFRGLVDAAAATLDGGLTTIEGVHTAIARKPFGPLGLVPGVAEISGIVRVVHDGITHLVYAGLHSAIAAGRATGRWAAITAGAADEEPAPGSRIGLAVAALNGFAGDRLLREDNPLAAPMTLRQAGRRLRIDRAALAAAFPDASPRLAVFVHGLAGNESLWQLHAERHYGDRTTTYGSRLRADLGYTPLYVRYNTGLHVSDNGRQLARLLDDVVGAWPVPPEELVLIAHSMGGLVGRSACHYGLEAGLSWVPLVKHVVFLGSPHLGAPLEKAANVGAWILGLSDITRPFSRVLNARSSGIKDLRFGALVDEDWSGVDLDGLLAGRTGDVPFLDGASHYFIAATVTRDPRHPLGIVVGDLLVREPSASARSRLRHKRFRLHDGRHFGPMTHFDLLNHPDVYTHIRRWLATH
jgi:hypothetical protein